MTEMSEKSDQNLEELAKKCVIILRGNSRKSMEELGLNELIEQKVSPERRGAFDDYLKIKIKIEEIEEKICDSEVEIEIEKLKKGGSSLNANDIELAENLIKDLKEKLKQLENDKKDLEKKLGIEQNKHQIPLTEIKQS
jgi:hypothetical protein